MYPETDIPPYPISREYLEELKRRLPPTLDEVAENLSRKYGLSRQIADELIDLERVDLFERIVSETGVKPRIAASILAEHMKSLKREGFKVELIRDSDLLEISRLIARGEIAKEAAPEIIKWLSENPGKNVRDALDALNLRPVDMSEVEGKIDELVERYGSMVRENPRKASSIIMGELMKVYRGRAFISFDSRRISTFGAL